MSSLEIRLASIKFHFLSTIFLFLLIGRKLDRIGRAFFFSEYEELDRLLAIKQKF